MHVLELFRPTVGAATLGFARRAMSEAVERSASRTTFKKPISEHQMIAKLFSTETAFDIIDEAVQIFGGLGVVRGTTVERLFRHARAFRIFDGTSEIQRLIIARNLLQHR